MGSRMFLLGLILATPVAGQGLPSGLSAELYDLVIEPGSGPGATTARFRFVAPALGDLPYEAVAADLPWLCENVALPELAANGWTAETIIVSVGDREVPLGEMDAGALQYFDAFRVADGTCILEVF